MQHFRVFTPADLQTLTKTRPYETKLGECLPSDWRAADVRYVLLGVAEDIGVRVNRGIGGTHTAWAAFLSAFLNIQSTDRLTGREMGVYGHFDFAEWQDHVSPETVVAIDAAVRQAVFDIAAAGKIPIVVGGGHNNAYPILRGVSEAVGRPLHAVNLDAHADYRRQEGRHSGNGFRYAHVEGFLEKYAVLGLHENYNAQNIVAELQANPNLWCCFWEDIFLRETYTLQQAFVQAFAFVQGAPTGIELDLDSIERVLSSAQTPVGISATQARQYLYQATQCTDVAYVHLCEGAAQLATGEQMPSIGKLLAYLVTDVAKGLEVKRSTL